jgi:dihydroflavonol-4-reductase
MPIFMTGGTGFLGVNLARHLVAQGKQVRLLVRGPRSRLGLESDLIEFVRGDVTDLPSVEAAMRGCDEVYHLAAWVQVSPWGMATARRVNVEGTRNVCSAALRLGVRRLVHTSSIASLATGTLDRPADEDTPWNLSRLRVPYYTTKRASEQVVLDHVRLGLNAVIVNPSYLVGPWDIKPSAGRLLIEFALGRVPLVPSSGGINYVDVREVAFGMAQAMERGRTGQRYFMGGENLPYESFARKVAAVAGVQPPRWSLPYGALFPLAAAGSALGALMPDRFRDMNLGTLRIGFLEHYATSKKACRELGYREIPIDRAISDALDWFESRGYMPDVRLARRPVAAAS